MFMINIVIRLLVEYYWIQGLNPISSDSFAKGLNAAVFTRLVQRISKGQGETWLHPQFVTQTTCPFEQKFGIALVILEDILMHG